ncbi:hypothetical protein ACFWO5_20385, partial [Rhodococcus sp. NPDC058481]|uniref:hypothetical protein n=1 Tax=Rhodococcus sp. NPDC058481 TaxID=3346523 RepID=UPI003645F879
MGAPPTGVASGRVGADGVSLGACIVCAGLSRTVTLGRCAASARGRVRAFACVDCTAASIGVAIDVGAAVRIGRAVVASAGRAASFSPASAGRTVADIGVAIALGARTPISGIAVGFAVGRTTGIGVAVIVVVVDQAELLSQIQRLGEQCLPRPVRGQPP